ncbi:MAG TPA: tRNA (adenosine(37)-N6)-threonylcarbamoyltransferase complex dimerization subunit type 1 TsaB [Clostridia bacterium]
MNYICIDAARKHLEIVGEYQGEELYYFDESVLQHSVTLMPAIQNLMQGKDWGLIDYIGVNQGPGSFTGIRIGVTTAKVFSYIKGIKIVPFNSLEMYAYNIYSAPGCTIVCAQASGNSQVYIAVYENQGERLQELLSPKVLSKPEFERFLSLIDEPVLIACDFDLPLKKDNFKAYSIRECKTGIKRIMSQADTRKTVDGYQLEPLYIQVPQAQRDL